jgi:ATP-binding cassette, subfamily B, bacterial PglK
MNFFLNFKSLFEKKDYNKIIIIIFLILAVTFAEILGIAAIIPFITVILAPERFENIEFMKFFVTINSYNHNQKLIIFSVIFFSIYLLKNIFIIFSNKFIYQFIYSFKEKTFIKLLELYLHQKFSFYNKKTFTEISNNLLNEVGQVATNYVRPILSLVSELTICLSIILLAIALGFYNIFFIALIFILCVSIILKILNKKIKALSQQRVKSNEGIMQLIFEFILGIKEIILSGNPFGLIKKLKDNQIHLKKIDINIDVLRL